MVTGCKDLRVMRMVLVSVRDSVELRIPPQGAADNNMREGNHHFAVFKWESAPMFRVAISAESSS